MLNGSRARPSVQVNMISVVRPDGSYVVTGGLGGIGLVVARWLVDMRRRPHCPQRSIQSLR